MNNFNTYFIRAALLPIFTLLALSAQATEDQTKSDAYILACGKAQIEANKCVKDDQNATTGLFGSLASKITSGDMQKTVTDKAAGQAASMICKDKIDAANVACKP